MRIAIYHNLTSGGAKRAMQEQMKLLSTRHTLDVFTISSAEHEFADIRPFASRHTTAEFRPRRLLRSPLGRLNQLIRLADLQTLRRLCAQIAAEIEDGGYDILLAHPCRIEGCSSVVRFVRKIPVVFYCQEPLRIVYEQMPWRPYDQGEAAHRQLLNRIDPLPGMYRRALRDGDQVNVRSASRVLVNSKNIQAVAKETYSIEARVSYLGVDTGHFRPMDGDRRKFVFSVGSLTPLKGFDFLIEALATIPVSQRPELVIASNFQNPPERQYLEQLAQQHGVSLELLGNISDDRLVELYNHAALVVYAPVREPFGFVSVEAMACATPVVGVAEGGLLETVISGKTGCLVERDAEQFGRAVSDLLAAAEQRREMGKAGRQHVLANWTWEKSVSALETHLSF